MASIPQRLQTALVMAFMATPLVTVLGQTGKACSLITRAEAAQILGKPKVSTAQPFINEETECVYGGAGFHLAIEEMDAAQRKAGLQSLVRDNKAEPVKGVGDEAVFWEVGDSLLMVRKGTRLLTITMYRNWGGPPAQLRPTLVKLATTALAKLR